MNKKNVIAGLVIIIATSIYAFVLNMPHVSNTENWSIGESLVLKTRYDIKKDYSCGPAYSCELKEYPIYVSDLCIPCKLENIGENTYITLPSFFTETFKIKKVIKLSKKVDVDISKKYTLQLRHININEADEWNIEGFNIFWKKDLGNYNSSWINVIDSSLYKMQKYTNDPTEYEITSGYSSISINDKNNIAGCYYRVWQSMWF